MSVQENVVYPYINLDFTFKSTTKFTEVVSKATADSLT